MLTLDHIIIRSADPADTLAMLAERAGLPVVAAPTQVGGITSGIARAGSIDIEVLAIGREAPERPHGYGLGFVADEPMDAALARLREAGIPTSAPVSAIAGTGDDRRRWRAAQVAGLLPSPFPLHATTRPPGVGDRLAERVGTVMNRVAPLARAATRRAGESMVVLTEYGFDVAAVRASSPSGPEVLEVHVGIGGNRSAWSRLTLAQPTPLRLHDAGPAGITRVVLAAAGPSSADFSLGDVTFAWRREGEEAGSAKADVSEAR